MKKCNKCKKEKPFSAFGNNKRTLDGYRNECKECRNAANRTGKPNLGRFQKGNKPIASFKKGNIPWNAGTKGIMPTPWNKGLLTNDKKKGRKYYKWANAVKERDNWTCQECNTKEGLIIAHHIIPWQHDESKRFDVENGKTLCQSCHAKLEGFKNGHANLRKTTKYLFTKGHTTWNKGVSMTEDTKNKIRESKKGQIPWNKGKVGVMPIPWNKGLKKA